MFPEEPSLSILARAKKAETVSNVIFWLGAGFLIRNFLSEMTTTTTWFAFLAATIMLIGVSVIARAIILAAVYQGPMRSR